MQTPFSPVPDWFPWENAGASIAVADLDADGRPDVVLLMVDAPPGRNAAFYRVGRRSTSPARSPADGPTGKPSPTGSPTRTRRPVSRSPT
jgi:hypothetical protein